MARNHHLMLAGVLAGLTLWTTPAAAEVRQYGDAFDGGGSIFFDGSTSNLEPEGEAVTLHVLVPARSLTVDVRMDDDSGQDLDLEITTPDGTVLTDGDATRPSLTRAVRVSAPAPGVYTLRIRGRSKSEWAGFRRSSFSGQALLDVPARAPVAQPTKARKAKRCTKKRKRTRACGARRRR